MSLEAGTRLGPYEILSPLGAGGMGEVYKARDTRLERTVALKILPPEFSSDPARRARFAREAKTISQLNHPHICVLHDIGEGVAQAFRPAAATQRASATVSYLVMEYLEGQTLAQRLARTGWAEAPRLQLDEALRIGAEIADALAAAHKRGVIHRDLKPSNIMLARSGSSGPPIVKLLDFGLAKVREHGERLVIGSGGPSGPPSAGPTETESITNERTLVGTLPYMAPEQVEGKPADARTDIWALGCVLYEMVTGARAFAGDSQASLITAIMSAEPPALSEAESLSPPAFDRLVRRCLAKSPDDRWDGAHDVAEELQWIGRGGVSVESASGLPRRRHRLHLVLGVLALIVGIAGASATLTWLIVGRRAAPERQVRHVLLDTRPADGLRAGAASQRTFNRPGRTAIALTPDGTRLVFAGRQGDRQQLFVHDIQRLEAAPIPNTEGADTPFLSPDGDWVGFWAAGALKKVRLDGGGAPVDICEVDQTFATFGASWGDDGRIVFGSTQNSGLWRVSSNGGTPEILTTPAPGELGHRLPHVLPGAQAVLFTVVQQVFNWETARVAVHRFGTKGWQVVVEKAVDARYLPTGHLVYFRRGRLMAAPFDLERLEVSGGEVGLVADVMQATNATSTNQDSGAAQATISSTGTLAYVTGGEVPDVERRLVWVDRQGQIEALSAPPRPYSLPRVSPDGRRVAVQTLQSERRLWLHDLHAPRSLFPVTSSEVDAGIPVWTREGTHLAYYAYVNGRHRLFLGRADGTQPPEELVSLVPWHPTPASWTPDGRLLYIVYSAASAYDVWEVFPKANTWDRRVLLDTPAGEQDAQVSPDGRWLAYTSDESGYRQVYLRRYPSLADKRLVAGDTATNPVWARNGRELFYVRGSGDERELVTHDIREDGTPAPAGRALFRLAPLRLVTFTPLPAFDVTPDGQRFVFPQRLETQMPLPPKEIHLVFDWFEELKAKLPRAR